MKSMTTFITRRLRLKVNEDKSSVGRPWSSRYLGFSLTNNRANPRIRIHWKTLRTMKRPSEGADETETRGRSLRQVIRELVEYLRGWWGYYRTAESYSKLFVLENWIRRRLRSLGLEAMEEPPHPRARTPCQRHRARKPR